MMRNGTLVSPEQSDMLRVRRNTKRSTFYSQLLLRHGAGLPYDHVGLDVKI